MISKKKDSCLLKVVTALLMCASLNIYAQEKFATQIVQFFLNSNPEDEIIFENNQPKETGAISNELLAALNQEESIIIVNSSLISWIMAYVSDDNILKDEDDEKNRISKKRFFKNFWPKNWIKRKINHELYVLIPKEYIQTRSNFVALNKLDTNKLMYSKEELAVGIKWVTDEKNIFDDNDFMESYNHENTPLYHEELDNLLINNLDKIFIKKSEYYKYFPKLSEKELLELMPQSVVIVSGHGSPYVSLKQEISNIKNKNIEKKENEEIEIKKLEKLRSEGEIAHSGGIIAGLSAEAFGKFIAYISQNLIIKLLFFSTCYGTEVNIQKALEATAKNLDQKLTSLSFPFPIISGALSASPTTSYSNLSSDAPFPDLKDFLTVLTETQRPSEQQIAQALQYIYKIELKKYNNIPIIKYKDLPWLIMDLPFGTIANIDEILTKTHDPKTPLDISTFFKGKKRNKNKKSRLYEDKIYPQIIAIKAAMIPFELKISEDVNNYFYQPYFISTIPGDSLQTIESIDASEFSLSQILSAFMPMSELKEYKIFNVKKITAVNIYKQLGKDTIKKIVLTTNVWTINGPDQHVVLFEYNNKFWFFDVSKNEEPKEISSEEFKKILSELPEIIQKKSRDLTEIKNLKFKKPKTEEEVKKETENMEKKINE